MLVDARSDELHRHRQGRRRGRARFGASSPAPAAPVCVQKFRLGNWRRRLRRLRPRHTYRRTHPRARADPKGGGIAGVAPGVRLISMKVLDGTGQGYTRTVLTALENVINNRGSFGIDVVNLSLGHPITEPAATDPLVQAVEALSRAGVIVVAAAGNWGRNPRPACRIRRHHVAGQCAVGDDRRRASTRTDGHAQRRSDSRLQLARTDVVRRPGETGSRRARAQPRLGRRRLAARSTRAFRISASSMPTGAARYHALERHQHGDRGDQRSRRAADRAASSGVSSWPLTPNDVKAVLQFTAIPVNRQRRLHAGRGRVEPGGRARCRRRPDAGRAKTDWRSTTIVQPTTTIGSRKPTPGIRRSSGATRWWAATPCTSTNPPGASQTTWGSAVIWGHGSPLAGDTAWDLAATWSTHGLGSDHRAVRCRIAWPELGGQAIIWGHGGPF